MSNTQPVDPSLEARVAADPHRFRVLTGDRPTGPLHLGHYFGTLANRVRLQDLGVETYLWSPTTRSSPTATRGRPARRTSASLVLDYLAAGIDPDRATIFAHSAVPALNQLAAAVPQPGQ